MEGHASSELRNYHALSGKSAMGLNFLLSWYRKSTVSNCFGLLILRNFLSQELKEMKRVHESRIAEMESGRRREFESKLSDALQGLRKQHEEQIQGYKEELERTFSAKVSL